MYFIVKNIHMYCALISISGFLLRAALTLAHHPATNYRFTKTAPHIVDTLLLGSALYLAVSSHQFPFVDNWLTAKLLALLLYIGFGLIALRFGQTQGQRLLGTLLALTCFTYIVGVALTRNILVLF